MLMRDKNVRHAAYIRIAKEVNIEVKKFKVTSNKLQTVQDTAIVTMAD